MNYKNSSIQANIITRIEKLKDYIEDHLPQKGDTSETCQRTAILNSLLEAEYCINELEDTDFID